MTTKDNKKPVKKTGKKPEIARMTHKIDATDKVLGRLATEVAKLLQGKHKPSYQPHIDNGDMVIVSNISKIKITGKKLEQKTYYNYSGYPGGLKRTQMKKIFYISPEEVFKKTIFNMLPKNKTRANIIKRLKITK